MMWSFPSSLPNDTETTNIAVNGNNTSSPYVTTTVPFLPFGLLIFLMSAFGIVANILSAFVLLRPRMKSTYSTITLGLTFCDTVFLLTKLLRYGFQSMFTYFSVAREYTHVFYPLAGPALRAITVTFFLLFPITVHYPYLLSLTPATHTGFTYFTMAVAADRYFVVCWPVHARRLWSIRRSIYLSIGLIIFSILYCITRWWEFETHLMMESNGTDYYYKMVATDFRKNRYYRVPYKITYLFIMNFIPLISLAYMNLAIWRTIQETHKRKESLTSVQRKDKSFSLMLISIVVLFLLCSSVYFVTDVMEIFKLKYPSFWDNLGNFLLTLNSAVNFILYCVFGSRFRMEFVRLYKESLSCCYYRCILRREEEVVPRYDLSTTVADNNTLKVKRNKNKADPEK